MSLGLDYDQANLDAERVESLTHHAGWEVLRAQVEAEAAGLRRKLETAHLSYDDYLRTASELRGVEFVTRQAEMLAKRAKGNR